MSLHVPAFLAHESPINGRSYVRLPQYHPYATVFLSDRCGDTISLSCFANHLHSVVRIQVHPKYLLVSVWSDRLGRVSLVTADGDTIELPLSRLGDVQQFALLDGYRFIAPSGLWTAEFDLDHSISDSMRSPLTAPIVEIEDVQPEEGLLEVYMKTSTIEHEDSGFVDADEDTVKDGNDTKVVVLETESEVTQTHGAESQPIQTQEVPRSYPCEAGDRSQAIAGAFEVLLGPQDMEPEAVTIEPQVSTIGSSLHIKARQAGQESQHIPEGNVAATQLCIAAVRSQPIHRDSPSPRDIQEFRQKTPTIPERNQGRRQQRPASEESQIISIQPALPSSPTRWKSKSPTKPQIFRARSSLLPESENSLMVSKDVTFLCMPQRLKDASPQISENRAIYAEHRAGDWEPSSSPPFELPMGTSRLSSRQQSEPVHAEFAISQPAIQTRSSEPPTQNPKTNIVHSFKRSAESGSAQVTTSGHTEPQEKRRKVCFTDTSDNVGLKRMYRDKIDAATIKIRTRSGRSATPSSDEDAADIDTDTIVVNQAHRKQPASKVGCVARNKHSQSVPARPAIIFSSKCTIQGKRKTMQTFTNLGGIVVDDIMVADILCMSNDLRKTPNLVLAIILGKHVVTEKWLIDSVRHNAFVDTAAYLPKDKAKEREWNFELADAVGRSKKSDCCHSKLLANLNVYLTPGLERLLGKLLKDFKSIAAAMGSTKVYTRLPSEKAQKSKTIALGVEGDPDAIEVGNRGHCLYSRDLLTMAALRGKLEVDSGEFELDIPVKQEEDSQE